MGAHEDHFDRVKAPALSEDPHDEGQRHKNGRNLPFCRTKWIIERPNYKRRMLRLISLGMYGVRQERLMAAGLSDPLIRWSTGPLIR